LAEHSALTGADLHEPKGAAGAGANEVYLSNGAGSGTWTDLNGASVWEYASIYSRESDSSTIAGISTTPVAFTFVNNGVDNGATSDASNNRITVSTTGDYLVTFSVSFGASLVGDAGVYEFRVQDDGSNTILEASADADYTNMNRVTASVTGILSITSGSHITVTVASDEVSATDDITVINSHLSVVLLKAS
jgi:hypothetical protein